MTDAPTDPRPARPSLLLAAVTIALLETVALVAYALGIGVSDLQDAGSLAAGPVEIVIYLLFAAGVAVCGLGLWRRRRSARTPFGVVQLFGVIIGWTLTQGDGDLTHRIGYLVLAVAVVGIAVVISPGLGEALDS